MSEEQQLLVDKDLYLKAGIHIGTKFKTKHMERFIYKIRTDGLSVMDLATIDERIRLTAKFLAQYAPEEIVIVSRRENSWKAVRAFAKATGVRLFDKRYMPGIMTNPALKGYFEAKLLLVTYSWPDKNAMRDAMRIGLPIVALCDTNNEVNNVDLAVPCNNKGKKSLGLFFWILAREYLKTRGTIKNDEAYEEKLEDFTEEL